MKQINVRIISTILEFGLTCPWFLYVVYFWEIKKRLYIYTCIICIFWIILFYNICLLLKKIIYIYMHMKGFYCQRGLGSARYNSFALPNMLRFDSRYPQKSVGGHHIPKRVYFAQGFTLI